MDLKPPGHLTKATRAWWLEIASEWALEPHHIRVLTSAAQAWDRMEEARKEIRKRGLLVDGRFGPRANPAIGIEKDSRTAFLRAVRELDLDVEPPASAPRVRGRR